MAIRVGWASCGSPRSLPLSVIKHCHRQQPHKINLEQNNNSLVPTLKVLAIFYIDCFKIAKLLSYGLTAHKCAKRALNHKNTSKITKIQAFFSFMIHNTGQSDKGKTMWHLHFSWLSNINSDVKSRSQCLTISSIIMLTPFLWPIKSLSWQDRRSDSGNRLSTYCTHDLSLSPWSLSVSGFCFSKIIISHVSRVFNQDFNLLIAMYR